MGKVAEIVGEIMSASQVRSTGIHEINQAIVAMDQVTRQNAALVEEAAAAHSLQDMSATLAESVSAFKLDDTQALR